MIHFGNIFESSNYTFDTMTSLALTTQMLALQFIISIWSNWLIQLHLSNILVRELMVKARGLCINFHSTYGYFYVWFSSKCIDILHFDPFTWVFLLNVVLLNKSDTSIVLWEYNNTLISDVLRRNTNLLVHIILHTCDQYLLRIPINCIGIV